MSNDAYQPMTDAKLIETAHSLSLTWFEAADLYKINPEDLANIAAITAANVSFAAHGIAGIEKLRTAADAMEREVMSERDRDQGDGRYNFKSASPESGHGHK